MEYELPARPTRLSSKVSGILHHISRTWKFASSVAVSGDRGKQEPHMVDFRNGEMEIGDGNHNGKIHPRCSTDTRVEDDIVILRKLLDTISSLKLAYIKFQQAHVAYDFAGIQSADRLVVSHLESLSHIERVYVESQKNRPPSLAVLTEEALQLEEVLKSLQHQAQAKDTEVLRLGWEIEELVQRNIELEEEIKRVFSPEEEILLSYKSLNPSLLLPPVFEASFKSIHEFAKPLIGLMKVSGWNLDGAADSIVPNMVYAQRSHKKYAFEAYLSSKVFSLKEIPEDVNGNVGSVMKFRDPFDALVNDPSSSFGRFCISKYLSTVHLDMELAFFGHLDQRNLIMCGKHPATSFYRAFAKMARWAWLLLVLAAAMTPKAKFYYVQNGSLFVDTHMDSIVEGSRKSIVGFMVTPGLWIRDGNILRSRVYMS